MPFAWPIVNALEKNGKCQMPNFWYLENKHQNHCSMGVSNLKYFSNTQQCGSINKTALWRVGKNFIIFLFT